MPLPKTSLGLALAGLLVAQGARDCGPDPEPPRPDPCEQLQIRAADYEWARGKAMLLSAAIGAECAVPLGGRLIDFWVDDERLCTSQTDEHGRAYCRHVTPSIPNNLPNQTLVVRLQIDDGEEGPVQDTGLITLGPPRHGRLRFDDSPDVDVRLVDGFVGQEQELRAEVTRDGLPVAGRLVDFTIGHNLLGTMTTNAAGVARVWWTPEVADLQGFAADIGGFHGGLQVWVRPDGEGTWTGSTIGRVYLAGQEYLYDPCAALTSNNDEQVFPTRCERVSWPGTHWDVVPAIVRARNGHPDDVEVLLNSSFQLLVDPPPTPALNPDCPLDHPRFGGGCHRDCFKLEYWQLFDSHGLQSIVGQTPASCDWAYQGEEEPEAHTLQLAYDLCAVAAWEQGLQDAWDHEVQTSMHARVLAAWWFRNPHVLEDPNGGAPSFHLVSEVVLRDGAYGLPVQVRCTQ